MSRRQYLKTKLPAVCANLFGMLFLSLFLLACGNSAASILFLLTAWLVFFLLYEELSWRMRKKYLDSLLHMAEQLEEKYLIAEVMDVPKRADDCVFYEIMKTAEKSMLETIGKTKRERQNYREYIEQWVHEAKTPITAMRLLCENHPPSFTRDMMAELENMNRFTEQALYYARMEHTEKDYSIREINLESVIHDAIADNKYLLRQNHVQLSIEPSPETVYTDEKWVRFILNQLISNAVKYKSREPSLSFFFSRKERYLCLSVKDNGIGIPLEDLPRIFEKGFTGTNGRIVKSSTGMGLYLCRQLSEKLGIGLHASSDNTGTCITLSFHINDFISEVQNI